MQGVGVISCRCRMGYYTFIRHFCVYGSDEKSFGGFDRLSIIRCIGKCYLKKIKILLDNERNKMYYEKVL